MTIQIPAELAKQLGLLSPGDEAYLSLASVAGGSATVNVESQSDEASEHEEIPGESVPETAGELNGPQPGEMAGPLPPALKRALGA